MFRHVVGTWSCFFFFFSSRRRHTRLQGDWSSDVCSSDLYVAGNSLVVQQRLAFANRQLVSTGDADRLRLIVVVNRPFRLLVVPVQCNVGERRETGVCVRHHPRQIVGNQETQAGREALLQLHLEGVIKRRSAVVEIVKNTRELWERTQRLKHGGAASKVIEEIRIRNRDTRGYRRCRVDRQTEGAAQAQLTGIELIRGVQLGWQEIGPVTRVMRRK